MLTIEDALFRWRIHYMCCEGLQRFVKSVATISVFTPLRFLLFESKGMGRMEPMEQRNVGEWTRLAGEMGDSLLVAMEIETDFKVGYLRSCFSKQLGSWKNIGREAIGFSQGREVLIWWTEPLPHCIKINVNGTAKGNPKQVVAGCVLRNHNGKWIIGAAKNLGICSSL